MLTYETCFYLYVDGEIGIGIGGNIDTPYKFKNINIPASGNSQAFHLEGVNKTFADWVLLTKDTSSYSGVNFADPTRSIAGYQAKIGAPATIAAFIDGCRGQSRDNWNSDYTAKAVNSWLKAGFAR